MRRAVIMTAMLLLTQLAMQGSAAPAEPLSGDRVIRCEAALSWTTYNCDRDAGYDRHPRITVESQRSVTLTVTWRAETNDAEEFTIWLYGNRDCADGTPGSHSCYHPVASGRSPLRVTLRGVAATHTTVEGYVGVATPCQREAPCAEPARIVRDQPFHFAWTLR